jgi:hypothetical protein
MYLGENLRDYIANQLCLVLWVEKIGITYSLTRCFKVHLEVRVVSDIDLSTMS